MYWAVEQDDTATQLRFSKFEGYLNRRDTVICDILDSRLSEQRRKEGELATTILC